jgi:RNA polymerase sigma-70 factor (ECF subfamily)
LWWRAGQRGSADAADALAKLCTAYWYPLYAHVRRQGLDADTAQDLTQEFFARLLEKNYLAQADRVGASPTGSDRARWRNQLF